MIIKGFVSKITCGLIQIISIFAGSMNRTRSLLLLSVFVLGLISCKSTYEKVRTSNDPDKILKAADNYYAKEDYLKAQGLYELVIPFYRGKKEAEELFYKYSYCYYNQGEYFLASHYFNNFVKTFYNSTRKEEMAYMSAYANYKMAPIYKLDQSSSEKAIEELQTFINLYPNSPRVEECNELMDGLRSKLELKSFEQGKLYYEMKSFQAAMTSLENTLKDFPETKEGETIRYLIVKSSTELAKNSVYEKMQDRLNKTITLAEKYISRYPESDKNKEVAKIIDFCNNELKRFI